MEDMVSAILMIAGGVIAALVLFKLAYWLLSLRRVVPTNEVHVVQSSKRTTSYGKDTTDKMGAAVLKSLTDNAANDTPATGKITPPVASEHSDAPKPHKTKSA